MYGLIGFIVGFIAGMIANRYLLRDVSAEEMRKNKDLRLKYGALNWAIAILGLIIGIALQDRL